MKYRIIAIKEFAEDVIKKIGVIWFIILLPLLLLSFVLFEIFAVKYDPDDLFSTVFDKVILLSSIVLLCIIFAQLFIYVQIIKVIINS